MSFGFANFSFASVAKPKSPPPPPPDSDVILQLDRISTDGGTVLDPSFLHELIPALKNGGDAGDCYSAFDALYIADCCKLEAGDKISKVYDISKVKGVSTYHDVVQAAPEKYQTLIEEGLDGRAVINFDMALEGSYITPYYDILVSPPATIFAISRNTGATYCRVMQVSNIQFGYDPELLVYAGTHLFGGGVNTGQYGLFTARFNEANSYLRRKGVQLIAGDSGNVYTQNHVSLGGNPFGHYLHGDIAVAGYTDQDITDAQRDHIESVFNTYWPSTV